MPYYFTHGYVIRTLAKYISPAGACYAVHPTLGFQIEHDLFQETFWRIVPPRQFPNGNRGSAKVVHQSEQSAQCIVSLPGNFHSNDDKISRLHVNPSQWRSVL